MERIIRNMGDFSNIFISQLEMTLKSVAEEVKKEIDKAIDKYYDEYDPNPYSEDRLNYKSYWYHRTDQLRECCKIGKIKKMGNVVSIEVYLDIESLNYLAKGADPYKTVVAANAGLHGGWDIGEMVQIPWSDIKGNDGKLYGNGTQIWEEPMKDFINSQKLITTFKKCAKQHGLVLD